MSDFQISLVEKMANGRYKNRTLLKPISINLDKTSTYGIIEGKCILSDEATIQVNGIILEVTSRDLIKLNALYSTNMVIFNEESEANPAIIKPQV